MQLSPLWHVLLWVCPRDSVGVLRARPEFCTGGVVCFLRGPQLGHSWPSVPMSLTLITLRFPPWRLVGRVRGAFSDGGGVACLMDVSSASHTRRCPLAAMLAQAAAPHAAACTAASRWRQESSWSRLSVCVSSLCLSDSRRQWSRRGPVFRSVHGGSPCDGCCVL